jgi:hypothetical protein
MIAVDWGSSAAADPPRNACSDAVHAGLQRAGVVSGSRGSQALHAVPLTEKAVGEALLLV